MNKITLACKALTLDYGSGTCIGPLDIEMTAGSCIALVGENGAGKSSLIHMLLGLRKPTSGRVFLQGLNADLPGSRLGVGYLQEAVDFPERARAYDLLRLHAELAGRAFANQSDCSRYIEEYGIELSNKPLKVWSKGMKQRLGLAIAMLDCQNLLVLDEPNSGLDPVGIAMLRSKLDRLKKMGVTLIISTHRLAEVMPVADRAIMLHQGRIAGDTPMSDFADFSAFERYFLDRVGA